MTSYAWHWGSFTRWHSHYNLTHCMLREGLRGRELWHDCLFVRWWWQQKEVETSNTEMKTWRRYLDMRDALTASFIPQWLRGLKDTALTFLFFYYFQQNSQKKLVLLMSVLCGKSDHRFSADTSKTNQWATSFQCATHCYCMMKLIVHFERCFPPAPVTIIPC